MGIIARIVLGLAAGLPAIQPVRAPMSRNPQLEASHGWA